MMYKLKHMLSWSPKRVRHESVLLHVAVYSPTGAPIEIKCWIPLKNFIKNSSACESFNSTFVENMLEGGFVDELDIIFKDVPNNQRFWSLRDIGRHVFIADVVNRILGCISLHVLLPLMLPLKHTSIEDAINILANLEDVPHTSLLALAYEGPISNDMCTILNKVRRSKFVSCMRKANLTTDKMRQFQSLINVARDDTMFVNILANSDVGLTSAVASAWPISTDVKSSVLKRCFQLNIVNSITYQHRYVACSMFGDDNISLEVSDGMDGVLIMDVEFDSTLINDISPLFLEQLLSLYSPSGYQLSSGVPQLLFGKRSAVVSGWKQNLFSFKKFDGFRADVLPLSFTPNDALILEIVKSGSMLATLLPLVYVSRPVAYYTLALTHYFNGIYTADMLFMFTYIGPTTRDLDVIMRGCNPAELLDYIVSSDSTLAVTPDKEKLIALISPHLPETNKWRTPRECCVCIEDHYGRLDVCDSHPVCSLCFDRLALKKWPIECPLCRTKNNKYILE